jgi:hypothetical protein
MTPRLKFENSKDLLSFAQKLIGRRWKMVVDRGDPQLNKCGPGIHHVAKVIQNFETENFQSP